MYKLLAAFDFILILTLLQNAKKQTGESALHVACYMNRLNAVKVLVEKGADANVVNQVNIILHQGYCHTIEKVCLISLTVAIVYNR